MGFLVAINRILSQIHQLVFIFHVRSLSWKSVSERKGVKSQNVWMRRRLGITVLPANSLYASVVSKASSVCPVSRILCVSILGTIYTSGKEHVNKPETSKKATVLLRKLFEALLDIC